MPARIASVMWAWDLVPVPPRDVGVPITHLCHGRKAKGVELFKSLHLRTAGFGRVAVGVKCV